jgi:hypothetical protein
MQTTRQFRSLPSLINPSREAARAAARRVGVRRRGVGLPAGARSRDGAIWRRIVAEIRFMVRLRVGRVFLVAEWTSADRSSDRPNPPHDPPEIGQRSPYLRSFTANLAEPRARDRALGVVATVSMVGVAVSRVVYSAASARRSPSGSALIALRSVRAGPLGRFAPRSHS